MNKEIEYLKKYLKDKDMETAIKELENGVPVQYIVGNVDFYGNIFKINKNTLIPRFETELLVEKTIKYINKYFNNEIKILDIGTGSGCIAITLNKLLDNSMVTAVDISKEALDVARAVRLTHIPTGIIVYSQTERSQIKNKELAFKILKTRLYDMKLREQEEKEAAERKVKIGTGDRSEKIRTYNYPQNRITDHRIGYTSMNLDRVMDGDMEDLIEALINENQKKKLEGTI